MKILVTGASGFLGSHLVPKLKGEVKIYQDNLLSDLNLKRKLTGISTVIHLAGEAGRKGATTSDFFEKNTAATLRLLQFAEETKVSRIIFPSTAAVYGSSSKILKEDSPLQPQNDYGLSKMLAEEIIKYFVSKGIKATVLRFNNIYGPANLKGVVFQMIESALKNKKIDYDEGKTRDFLFVEDAISAIIKSVDLPKDFALFNISGEQSLTLKQLAFTIKVILEKKNHQIKVLKAGRKVERLNLDISKAKKYLKWQPQVDLREGLETTINSILKQNEN